MEQHDVPRPQWCTENMSKHTIDPAIGSIVFFARNMALPNGRDQNNTFPILNSPCGIPYSWARGCLTKWLGLENCIDLP